MTSSRVARCLLLLLLLATLPTFAFAATTEFRVLFDTDFDPNTGCNIGDFLGAEQVLVTQVSNDDTTPAVTRSFRQVCTAGSLGLPLDDITTGWPASWLSSTRTLTLETRIPFAAFGSGMPNELHVGFDVTRGAATHQAVRNIDGTPVIIPAGPIRRRVVNPGDGRTITMDGVLLDWGGTKPVISGIVSDGTQALRLLKVLSFANSADQYIYFAAQAHLGSASPFADDDLYERDPGTNLNVPASAGVLLNDGHPLGLPLTATKVSEPLRGSVTLNPDGGFTYSPNNPASHLPDEFEYKATTGTSDSNVARVLIRINTGETPEGPPVDDAYETREDQTLVVPAPGVLENDPGKQNLVASLFTPPSHGTVTLNADGGFTYKPATNFFGDDSFVYTATRTTSGKVVGNATVTIEVTRVNDAPSFTPGPNITRSANSGPYAAQWATNISPGAGNESGQILTFTVTNNNNALFSAQPQISSTGVLTFTPSGILGTATVTVVLSDNGGTANGGDNTSDPVTFTITITCGNIVVTSPANNTATVGSPFSATFTQTGATGTATFSTASTLPAGITLSATGVLSGTPTQSGSFPITVTVTDSNGCTGNSSGYVLTVSCQTITVINPATNTGVAGAPFSQTFTQVGALGGATFSTSSTLPAGLTLATNGVLSGTPTQTGTFPIVVTVTDGNGCTGTGPIYTLTITCQVITVTNPANNIGTANSPFSETFTQTGAIGSATFTLASGTLPTGLTLATNGVLSGTPTQTGSFPITVTVTDANGCTGTGATYTIVIGCQTITVNNPANNIGTANSPFSETFTASNTIGTTTFTLASGSLPSGITLAANGTLAGTPTQTGSFPITVTATDANGCSATGPTYNLTINCQTITVTNPANTIGTVSAPFSEQFTQTGAIGTATFTTASTLPAGLTLSASGLLSGTPTQNGTFPITVTVTDSNGCTGTSATYNLIINCQTIMVTNPANATGAAGSPFSETFTQTGAVGSATFTLASGVLPTGMTLAANGVLSGTPTQNGTFPITVTVTDSNGCTGTGTTYNLTITCQTITVTNPANGNGTANSPFSETFTQTGAIGSATFTLASGTLPAGLTLATNGVLSGTPTQTGSFPITVMVTDANGCTGTGPTYTIVIACQTITVNNPANGNGTANSAFSETFTQTGAIGTATFTLASGTLPAGLTLATNGVLSGTPTQTGSFPITVTVTDSNGCTGTGGTYTIVIACQTITVNNPANANGTANSPFSETFTSSNTIGTVTYTLASGSLPAGLTLATNGVLSGTPTQTGNFPITVTATDANGCTGTSATYNLNIVCQTITVTNPPNAAGQVNAAFSETFTQTGAIGTATFTTASTLPAGLTLATNGVLSGTPTQPGNFPIVVTVTDSNGCTGTSATYNLVIACQTITVTNPANATGPAGSPFSETFTQTGAVGTATFTLDSGTLPTGLTLATNGVLSGTPTQGGTFPITVLVTDSNGCTGTGPTYNLIITCPVITVTNPANGNGTVNVAFSETFSQSGGQGTITYTLASGSLPAGLSLATNGVLSGTPTQTGSFPITVTATDQNGCTGTGPTYTIVIACQTITVNNPANANGTANSAFSETFTSTNTIGAVTYTLASGSLPAGLTLATNGTVSGTPTQVGNFPITVTATDANGCTGTSGTYTIVIGCQTITVTNPSNASGTINVAFSETFTQTGAIGSATFTTASTLPNGITLATNGVLSGTPTQTGNFPIVVTVTDANGCTGTSATYNLNIACQTITVTNPANANGTVGSVFSETFTQTGANGTPTFTTSSTLPAGITLATNGVLSGTPTQAGNFPIVVTVTDSNGCTGTSATYNLVITCQTITVNNPANANGTVDAPFSETFTQTGGIGTTTFSTSSTLPSGLTLAANGVLSGTPGEDGTFPIVVTATDSNGCTGTSSTYNLVIACQTITVTNPAVTTGTVDAAFNQTFTQTGVGTHTPITWSISGTLPSGLTFNTGTGVLSGTPGQPGNFPVTVTATDANGCSGTGPTYNLVIACQTITVTNPGVNTATYNSAFSQTFTQSGVGTHTPAVWSVTGTLPTGITLNTSTGVLSGTPTQTGTFPITVTVTDANNCAGTGPTYTLSVAPVAVNDSFSNAVHNTQFVLTGGTTTTPSTPSIQVAGTIEVNDLPSAATVTVTAGTFATTNGGSVTIAADGTFLYTGPAQPGIAPPATDTFTYTVSSNTGGTGPVTSAPATVTINLTNRVWYVKNDSAAGGDGRSHQPFDTLVEAETASTAGDIIYVYFGNGTTSGQNAGIVLKANQKLYGQGIALVVNTQTLVAAGSQPQIGHTNAAQAAVRVQNISGVEIKGLNIGHSAANDAVGITTTGGNGAGVEVSDNTIRQAGTEGIDANHVGSGAMTLSIHDNVLTANGAAISIIRAAGGGTVTITAFDDNTVTATSVGGINVQGTGGVVTFDAVPGGGFNAVSGGITTIGSSGDRIGAPGLTLNNVAGILNFTDLDIFTDSGAALLADGGTGGFTLTVTSGASTLLSNAGAAALLTDITGLDLQLAAMTSLNSPNEGVLLSAVTGTFSAPAGASITNPTGTAFSINGGTVNSTYNGVIYDNTGTIVAVANSTGGTKIFAGAIDDLDGTGDPIGGGAANNGGGISLTTNTGATIRFMGGINLSTGATASFVATGGGTVEVCDDNPCAAATGALVNTLTSTTGTTLNVANTTIGANDLEFRSISANGAASGIILNTTGALGSLEVNGNGGSCTSAATCTGGAIQNTTGHGINLTTTQAPTFTRIAIQNTGASGINGTGVIDFTLANSFLDNNGTGGGADESNLAFDVQTLGTENNLSGVVSITNNTLTNARWHGIRILNFNGTISDLVITGNTITSSTAVASSLGSGMHIQAIGSPTTVSNITKANISSNTITNFPSDAGIEIKGGNSTAGGPGGLMGTPGNATNIINITSNSIRGQSAANRMGTMFIDIGISGGNSSSRSQANFNISSNGTVAVPLAHSAGIGIGLGNTGYATSTVTMDGNVLTPNNTVASAGIGGGNGLVSSSSETPDLTWTITNNTISNSDGNGILAVARAINGIMDVKIQNNTVGAPLTGVRPGIRIDAGNGTAGEDAAVCLNISGNTSAGSGGTQGIGLRKQGTTSTVNDFGIHGLPGGSTATPNVEAYVNSQNPAGNGTLLISATSGFSTCSFP